MLVNFTDQGLKGVEDVPNGKTNRARQSVRIFLGVGYANVTVPQRELASRLTASSQTTKKLDAQDRVILFCATSGIENVAVGILASRNAVHGRPGIHGAQSRDRGLESWLQEANLWRG
jgi:hypothetical protein